MTQRDDIWYAAKATKIVQHPESSLETFGQTAVNYYVVTDLLDVVEQVRIRQGKVMAERPQVITPHFLAQQALENFGAEAREYVESMLNSAEGTRILRYGLRFRKEEYSEEIVAGVSGEVADQISSDMSSGKGTMTGVIIGVDDLWEVSLLHFMRTVISSSAPQNFNDLASRGLLETTSGNVPNAVRIEIESDFREAEGDADRVRNLGRKLRDYGVFDDYEDRFFDLYRRYCR